MDLHHESSYPADPYAVFGMLTDQSFLDRRATETKALRYEVDVTTDGAGTTSARTRRSLPTEEIPQALRKLVGETIELDEVIAWGPPQADGGRTGQVELEVAGVPVRGSGTMRLVAEGARTRQVVELEIKASVPVIGRKVEEAAAPAVRAALEVEEELGRAWLSGTR